MVGTVTYYCYADVCSEGGIVGQAERHDVILNDSNLRRWRYDDDASPGN